MNDKLERHLETLHKYYWRLKMTAEDCARRKAILEHIARNRCSSTWQLRRALGEPSEKTRRELRKMEKLGFVRLHSYSSVNNLVWELV